MMDELLEQYRNYQLIKGYNKDTGISRTRQVRLFLEHLEKQGITALNKIESKHIHQYYESQKNRENKVTGGIINPNTIYHHIRAIELFFECLQDNGVLQEVPEIHIKRNPEEAPEYIREILNQSEIQQLYQSTENYQQRIILHLAYGCGLRSAELVAVNKQDIHLQESLLIVPKGKFNKRRIIPLTGRIIEDIEIYLSTENKKPEYKNQNALIPNNKNVRMQGYTYNKILKKLLKASKVRKGKNNITLHSLRHSIATHLLANGMELEKVREFLGHNQLETTQIYTHISKEQLENLQYAKS